LQLLKHVKIRRVETRPEDAWYDMNLRQLRTGEVTYYTIKDFLTGDWLIKLCRDREEQKILLKVVKCPAGILYSQLEGKTMVFQQSKIDGLLYDVLSLSQADDKGNVRRKVVSTVDEVPDEIKENYDVRSYEEATGKKAPGKHLVTLCNPDDEKAIVTLFLLERAWPLSDASPEEKLKETQQRTVAKPAKREVKADVWVCPVCGKQHQLVHIETETKVKHALRKPVRKAILTQEEKASVD